MNYPLHGYQLSAVDWMLKKQCGYLAIDMGLGKTRIVLEYIQRADIQTTLVVAPLRVALHTWPSEIKKWAPMLTFNVLHGSNKSMSKWFNVFIINYEGLKWLIHEPMYKFFKGLLIIDEGSMVKSPKSQRFKILNKIRGLFSHVFVLSGTPMPNGYQDLWSQYFLLDRGKSLGATYTTFFNRYFLSLESFRIVPRSRVLLNEIPTRVAPVTFRLSSEDYSKLPPAITIDKEIMLTPKLEKVYKDLEHDFAIRLNEETNITALNAAVLSTRLRQFCQGFLYYEEDEGRKTVDFHNLKVETLASCIDELNGHPTLVAVQFKADIIKIQKALGALPVVAGGVDSKTSVKYIEEWNAGKIPVLLVHPGSISHGVNLQHGGNNIVWYAQTWNMEHYQQLNGRLRRQGQKKPVVITRLLTRNTIEHKVIAALAQKGENQQRLLNALRQFTNELLAKP